MLCYMKYIRTDEKIFQICLFFDLRILITPLISSNSSDCFTNNLNVTLTNSKVGSKNDDTTFASPKSK